MAQFTLLQMTQGILSEMGSDEVNSISDTTESLQVANMIQTKYYDILAREALPEHEGLIGLTASNDPTKPVLMTIPNGVCDIEWIKYYDSNNLDSQQVSQFGSFSHDLNTDIAQSPAWLTTSTTSNTIGLGTKTWTVASGLTVIIGQLASAQSGSNTMFGTVTSYSGTTLIMNITAVIGSGTFTSWVIANNANQSGPPGYKYVTILPNKQFLDIISGFNPLDSDVASFTFTENGNTYTFLYKNDHQPQYCTILSNNFVIFDMFDSTQDTTLQTAKMMCYGRVVPAFSLTDNFIPNIEDNKFALLINEAKALAFYTLKQQPHAKAEQELKRQWSVIQKTKSIANKPSYFDQLPSFGRQPRTGGYGTIWPRLNPWS